MIKNDFLIKMNLKTSFKYISDGIWQKLDPDKQQEVRTEIIMNSNIYILFKIIFTAIFKFRMQYIADVNM